MATHLTDGRRRFLRERSHIRGESDSRVALDPSDPRDGPVSDALSVYADAADPERTRPALRKPRSDGTLVDASVANETAGEYLKQLRVIHQRGFDLLDGTADEFNDFMADMVDGRLESWNGSIMRTTARCYQSAAVSFYRFCTEPGHADDRPTTAMEWPVDDIHIYTDKSDPRHDEADMFEDAEVDALREACVYSSSPRRDRAFVEVLAGTCQRLTAIRTLLVADVYTDPSDGPPYLLLNPMIRGDGDKGAIDAADRWRPIVSDVGPIREWIANHPLRDPEVRRAHGCPERFEDCYLFVGDPENPSTDASRPWNESASRRMLRRRREKTASLPNHPTVTKPVNPHNFRHFAYSKSKQLPIDEDVRRKVFGWGPGSTTGDQTYGHVGAEQHGRQFAEEWAEAFDGGSEEDVAGIAEQITGDVAALDLSREAAQAVVRAAFQHVEEMGDLKQIMDEEAG